MPSPDAHRRDGREAPSPAAVAPPAAVAQVPLAQRFARTPWCIVGPVAAVVFVAVVLWSATPASGTSGISSSGSAGKGGVRGDDIARLDTIGAEVAAEAEAEVAGDSSTATSGEAGVMQVGSGGHAHSVGNAGAASAAGAEVADLAGHDAFLAALCGSTLASAAADTAEAAHSSGASATTSPTGESAGSCIFFTLHGIGTEQLSPVAQCSLESTAAHHPPQSGVNIVLIVTHGHVDLSQLDTLRGFDNIHVLHTTPDNTLASAPRLIEWYRQAPDDRDITDVLGGMRLALLERWGGLYLDLDIFVLQPLAPGVLRNTFGVQDGEAPKAMMLIDVAAGSTKVTSNEPLAAVVDDDAMEVIADMGGGRVVHAPTLDTNNAVLAMDAGGELARTCLDEFIDGFDPRWGGQGPLLLRRVVLRLLKKYPNGIPQAVLSALQPRTVFYPVQWYSAATFAAALPAVDATHGVDDGNGEADAVLAARFDSWAHEHGEPMTVHLWSARPEVDRSFNVETVMAGAFHAACPATYAACVANPASSSGGGGSAARGGDGDAGVPLMCPLHTSFYDSAGVERIP